MGYWEHIVALYLLMGTFMAGKEHDSSDEFPVQMISVCCWVLLGPADMLFNALLSGAKKLVAKIDDYTQFKFYWVYLRGGFYDVDENRLALFDRLCFKREHNSQTEITHRHFIYVANLIFKRNNYTRKKWAVKGKRIIEA